MALGVLGASTATETTLLEGMETIGPIKECSLFCSYAGYKGTTGWKANFLKASG